MAVIGRVGSGKSSLLMAILGEMTLKEGRIGRRRDASVVYAEQEPLIVTGTVRSNILFGMELDERWYNQVVEACALTTDFQQMGNGDLTQVGEMGQILSGG